MDHTTSSSIGTCVCVCVCVCVQQHDKLVREKKRTLKQVKKSITELADKNAELMKELESLNVAVNERRHIDHLSGGRTLSAVLHPHCGGMAALTPGVYPGILSTGAWSNFSVSGDNIFNRQI